METKVQLTQEQLLTALENTVKRIREQDEKKKYHLTEQELKEVIKYFVDKSKN